MFSNKDHTIITLVKQVTVIMEILQDIILIFFSFVEALIKWSCIVNGP